MNEDNTSNQIVPSEFPDNSTITVAIKTGHTYKGVSFRKQEARVEVTSEEAVKSFWDSIDSASSKDTILRGCFASD